MLLLYIQIALLAALPLLVATAFSLMSWNSLSRPWAFLIVGTVMAYSAYALIMYVLDPDRGGGAGYMVSVERDSSAPEEKHSAKTVHGEVIRYFLQPYMSRMAAFLVLSIPMLWALSRFFRRPS